MKMREQKTRLMLSLAIAVAFSAAGLLATNTQVPMGDDRTIVSDIRGALRGDPSLRHIRVQCQDGVVTLSGTVESRTEVSSAIEIAGGEPGVRTVISQLKIKHTTKPATAQDVASGGGRDLYRSRTPNSTQTSGTSNSTQTSGTSNSTKTSGTPNSTKTSGTPNSTKTSGTPNSTQTSGTSNPTKASGTPNSTQTSGTPKQ
jgi:BON domain